MPILEQKRVLSATLPPLREGADALYLGEQFSQVLKQGRDVLWVASEEVRLSTLKNLLSFFYPMLPIVSLPGWDCLPYDRVSPKSDILNAQHVALNALHDRTEPVVVLTSAAGFLLRYPQPQSVMHDRLTFKTGQNYDFAHIAQHLVSMGYEAVGTVRQEGTFAARGSLIDIFPIAAAVPIRLDFFGDELEKIRFFDPVTQRSDAHCDHYALETAHMPLLGITNQKRFQEGYRALFGTESIKDAFYQNVISGQEVDGLEHWLPLFFERLYRLPDLLRTPEIILDETAPQALHDLLGQVQDHYEMRLEHLKSDSRAPYRPLPPEMLYLAASEVEEGLRAAAVMKSFGPSSVAKEPPSFSAVRQNPKEDVYASLATVIQEYQAQNKQVLLSCRTASLYKRLEGALALKNISVPLAQFGKGPLIAGILPLNHGFEMGDLLVLTDQDILGESPLQMTTKPRSIKNILADLNSFHVGDFLVHKDHGIGQFQGLVTLTVNGVQHECLLLEYAEQNKLYVPVENLYLLHRYGGEDSQAVLDRLGSVSWSKRREKMRENLFAIAKELLATAAERKIETLPPLDIDLAGYEAFCQRFPYAETEDQLSVSQEILEDLRSGVPVDRLVCGDVGFGKTEIAMRAAFLVAHAGQQVAVIAPTTLLAHQHAQNFEKRFEGFGLRIASLSRFVTARQVEKTRQEIASGEAQIVIGAHMLLNPAIKWHNLGLIVVDEEQHFGVQQKEKLKELRAGVHVLTLTATPIPRTLHLAVHGMRSLSLMTTPPIDRMAVRTFVMPHDPVVIREALLREHHRGGQSFYVCPRIADLEELQKELQKLVPELRVAQAHGQLPPKELEAVTTAFYHKEYDVLLSTNIIEAGIDIPTANTIIIHRSDLFGLAQLYQMRGRVGRSKVRAYAYLTVPSEALLTDTAKKRLQVMESLDTLGAGFTIASHDMDIRGAGNLVGKQQSGHIKEVGLELYEEMLEEAIAAALEKRHVVKAEWTPQLNLNLSVSIPESYIPDLETRMVLYRRASALTDIEEILLFKEELIDRFGSLPEEVQHLMFTLSFRLLCLKSQVERVDLGDKGMVLRLHENTFPNPDRLLLIIQNSRGTLRLRPDQSILLVGAWPNKASQLQTLHALLSEFVEAASL